MIKFFKWAIDTEREQALNILKEVLLFKGLSKKLLRKLTIDLTEKEYEPGEVIFAEGDHGKALYVVMSGSVKIIKGHNPHEKILATLGPGSYFGELALINQSRRYASVVAAENSSLLIMYKSYFDDLIKGNSAISSRILLNLVESLSNYIRNNQFVEEDSQPSQ